MTFSLDWLRDPQRFSYGEIPPHSDHDILPGNAYHETCLNGVWDFRWFESAGDLPEDFLSDSFWSDHDSIRVPGHMELEGFGQIQYVNTQYPWDGHEELTPPQLPTGYNPVGLYRRDFLLDASEALQPVRIVFDGAESCVAVFINGRFMGYKEDGFTPGEFDITSAVHAGENRVVALVARFCTGSWLEDQDFFRFSGLFRNVRLRHLPALHLEDIHAVPEVSEDLTRGLLQVRVSVTGVGSGIVRFLLWDSTGELIGTCEDGCFRVERPLLWSAETPHLYALNVQLIDSAGTIMEEARTLLGFRRFELKDGVMCLNGKRIVFHGVNRHEFHCDKGRALSDEDLEWDVRAMKGNNINAVRTSHYPNQSLMYRLCDRYGLYMVDEANLESHGTWMVMGLPAHEANALPGDREEWRQAVQHRIDAMFARDKNHPCVLFWSLGNESYGGLILRDMAERLRNLDGTRLIHYEGISWDRRYPETSDVESRMYAKPDEIRAYLADDPPKPFLHCEYAHAMGNSLGGLWEYMKLEDQYPKYQGGFIWDWIDQCVRKNGLLLGGDAFRRPTDGVFSGNGLLFADRTPTPKLAEVRQLYAPIRFHFQQDGVEIENRHLFKGTAEYAFRWRLMQDGWTAWAEEFRRDIPPGERAFVPLPFHQDESDQYECVWDIGAWEENQEIAYGQSRPFGHFRRDAGDLPARSVDGDCNVGFALGAARVLVSKESGHLTSLALAGRDLLAKSLRPTFWRAPTNNDTGNGSTLRWAQWKLASLYSRCEGVRLEGHTALSSLVFPTVPERRCHVSYTGYENGILEVELLLNSHEADLPCLGMVLILPARYQFLHFYGNTQRESYADRHAVPRLGRVDSVVFEEYVPYLKPQECSNRTDLRELTLLDSQGYGLRIFSDESFEASVLPYDSHELEQAAHQADLPTSQYTYVRLLKGQCGVGGDDSWGAPVHSQYHFHGQRFCVNLVPVAGRHPNPA